MGFFAAPSLRSKLFSLRFTGATALFSIDISFDILFINFI